MSDELDKLIEAVTEWNEGAVTDISRDMSSRARDKGELWPAHDIAKAYRGKLDAAVALTAAILPGWAWRVATCCVSDDAWVEPDFNDPTHGERLKVQLDQATHWTHVTDVDMRPSGNPARALLLSTLIGYRETLK